MPTIPVNAMDVFMNNPGMLLSALANEPIKRSDFVHKLLSSAKKDIYDAVREDEEFLLLLTTPKNTQKVLRFKRLKNDTPWEKDENGFTKEGAFSMIIISMDFPDLKWSAPQYQCAPSAGNSFSGPKDSIVGFFNKISEGINDVKSSLGKAKDMFDVSKSINNF